MAEITPAKNNIFVEEKGENFEINSNSDNQLGYAIKLLKI